MFPILFGAPSFGNEERDQWVRVLQLFLADPFAPHAVNVGGTTQVSYGWTVPAGAVVGNTWRNNTHGVREYNEFPDYIELAPNESWPVSDRAGFLFLYTADGNMGLFSLLSVGTDKSQAGVVIIWQDATAFGNIVSHDGVACYFDGATWRVKNTGALDVRVYPCVMSMGPVMDGPNELYLMDSFTGDGVTTDFTLSFGPVLEISATLNGIPVDIPGDADVPTYFTLEFNTPPAPGDDLVVNYRA